MPGIELQCRPYDFYVSCVNPILVQRHCHQEGIIGPETASSKGCRVNRSQPIESFARRILYLGLDLIESHAYLDLQVFAKIASALGINVRYVGEEPTSLVTGIYNKIMQEELPKAGVSCIVVPRKESGGKAISASTVRQCLKDGDFDKLRELVPESTLRYFESPEALPVLRRIRDEKNVIHY